MYVFGGPEINAFPKTFRDVVQTLEREVARKDEVLDFVGFGLHEMLLVRFENGKSKLMSVSPNPPKQKGD